MLGAVDEVEVAQGTGALQELGGWSARDVVVGKVMALIGNDFVVQTAPFSCRCSECSKEIDKGEECLVSIRRGRVQKRVCSEDCRLEFDSRFWDEAARNRSRA